MTPAEAATAPDLAVVETDAEVVVEADGATAVVEAEGALAVVDPAVAVELRQRKSGVFGEVPLALVIGGVGAGLVVIALHHFRWGNLLIAGSLIAGALLRSVLPTRRAGLLAVRARLTDVVTMAVMGAGLLVLALITST